MRRNSTALAWTGMCGSILSLPPFYMLLFPLTTSLRVSIPSSEQEVLSSHEAGVKSLVYSAPHNLLISASWDSTLHLHNLHSSSSSACTVPLPHKPFSLSVSATKLVVAMSNRALHIYDLQAITLLSQQTAGAGSDENKYATLTLEPWQRRESSLKFMTRAVACMPSPHPHPPFTPTAESAEHDPDATGGYASSSIEGRVAVEYFSPEPAAQALKYAFKCHRQPAQDGSGADVVYPVNALAFHPVHGTFASGGGDGVVALWDGVGKRRIRQYQKLPASVAALSFSKDGRWLAVGVSPGFEDGKEGGVGDEVGLVKVVVRELAEGEAKGKDKDKDKAK
jgi:cell cycle arrest protein BUB3